MNNKNNQALQCIEKMLKRNGGVLFKFSIFFKCTFRLHTASIKHSREVNDHICRLVYMMVPGQAEWMA